MNESMYELLALAGRYVFAGLTALVLLRAAYGAFIDSRRASRLRRMMPMTGLSGELVVLDGEGRARRGMRYTVIREGLIGSSPMADIRIRHPSVRRRHAYFHMSPDGLRVQSHAGARLYDRRDRAVHELVLGDGGIVRVGAVRMLLVLSLPNAPVDEALTEDAPDPFRLSPEKPAEREERRASAPRVRRGARPDKKAYDEAPPDADALFDVGDSFDDFHDADDMPGRAPSRREEP